MAAKEVVYRKNRGCQTFRYRIVDGVPQTFRNGDPAMKPIAFPDPKDFADALKNKIIVPVKR